MRNLVKFEDQNVEIIVGENGEPLFELYSVGKALGYEKREIKSGKEYVSIRKARIDEIVENSNIKVSTEAGRKYLSESQLYRFIMKSNTKTADKFMDWVTEEVLPSIRMNGCYVSDNITDQQQDLLLKYGMPRYRKQTFLLTPVEQLQDIYNECMEYHKKKSAKDRIKIEKEIINTLSEREAAALNQGSAALALMIRTEISNIQKKITARSNRSYGIKLAKANKQLNAANDQLYQYYEYIDSIVPDSEEYLCLNLHGFSVNSQYEPDVTQYGTVRNDYYGNPKLRKTDAYNNWLNKFKEEMDKLEDLKINFDNDINVYLYFDHRKKFDCHNLQKSFLDAFANYFNVDDRSFHLMICDTNEIVESYAEGKIYFCIRERTE